MPTNIALAKKSEVDSKATDPHGNGAHGPDFVKSNNFGLSEVLSNGNVDGGAGIFFVGSSATFTDSSSNNQLAISRRGINGQLGSVTTAVDVNSVHADSQLVIPEKTAPNDVKQGFVFDTSENRVVYRYSGNDDDDPQTPTATSTKNTL